MSVESQLIFERCARVGRHSDEDQVLLECRPSIYWDVDQVPILRCQSRVLINTRPQMPLVHMIPQVNQMRKEAVDRVVLENITKRREFVGKVREMAEERVL